MEIVSARLRAARLQKGLHQKELAEALDMDQGNLSRVEKGNRSLTGEQLRRAAKVLEVSTDYLLGTEPDGSNWKHEPLGEQARLATDSSTPPGLRELALDGNLVRVLMITEQEWHALSSILLPGEVDRDGYVQLLFTIRAVCQ
ncbi:helix-turn-helix domain-containing protein [Halomonas sp. G15]|uniref:helix-turn-helix domain-containing protein n=1 Tax=Halomonas sp. G15 TaxID=2903521 RepID=UPI001E3B4A8B|nr:helix-turn-helix transcriptional regulator [Halomonas sp. G15]MCE0732472.1 helix-turn-helix domain-containing protein [Halomonas sp. G15]